VISVRFFSVNSDSSQLIGFRVSGHTGIQGESVICAAVSSACYMAANTVTDVLLLKADISLRDGYMQLVLSGSDASEAQVILQGLRIHLEQLAEQYPKNIKIEFSEVQHNA
jgi:hypothetical protein